MELLHTFFQKIPMAALFLSVAAGYWIGNFKIGNFSLGGMAGTLLVAVIIGQIGVPVDPVVKDMMFALFIYATGYVSGPQFFTSLNRKTFSQLHLALISAITVFVLIFAVAKVMDLDKGTAAGLLAGATTESASIGTAGEALQRLGLGADKIKELQGNIGVTYAITYLFGMLTVIFFASRVAPRLMRTDLKREARNLENTLGGTATKLAPGQYDAFGALRARVYQVTQNDAVGMTVADLEDRFSVRVEQAAYQEKRIDVTPDLTLQNGFRLALQGKLDQVGQAGKFVGKETANLSALGFINEERDVVVTRKDLIGKTIAEARGMLDLKHRFGVYASRLKRLDQEIPMYPQTELHSGDVVRIVGEAEDVAKAADLIGYSLVPSKLVDYVFLGLGVLAGILIGMITVSVAGVPIGLGTGGGCLISGLVFGWLRAKHPTFGNLPGSTAQYLRDFGLARIHRLGRPGHRPPGDCPDQTIWRDVARPRPLCGSGSLPGDGVLRPAGFKNESDPHMRRHHRQFDVHPGPERRDRCRRQQHARAGLHRQLCHIQRTADLSRTGDRVYSLKHVLIIDHRKESV